MKSAMKDDQVIVIDDESDSGASFCILLVAEYRRSKP